MVQCLIQLEIIFKRCVLYIPLRSIFSVRPHCQNAVLQHAQIQVDYCLLVSVPYFLYLVCTIKHKIITHPLFSQKKTVPAIFNIRSCPTTLTATFFTCAGKQASIGSRTDCILFFPKTSPIAITPQSSIEPYRLQINDHQLAHLA
jgi:hypothetical protein